MMKRYSALIALIAMLAQCRSAPAVLTLADGRNHVIDYQVPTIVEVDRNARGAGTQVDVVEGGFIRDGLTAYEDSNINISGGRVDRAVNAYGRSHINLTDGAIGWFLRVDDKSWLEVSGGSVESDVKAAGTSEVTIVEGYIAGRVEALDRARVTVSGGHIGEDVAAKNTGRITVSGGRIDGDIRAWDSGLITLVGSDFAVNGTPVGYGDFASEFGGSGTITGIFANGDTLDNRYRLALSRCDITFVPEPATILILGLGSAALLGKNRRRG